MLKVLRKNTKLIIWAIILSFSLWGAYSVTLDLQKKRRLAGEVFGSGVSYQEFNQFYAMSQMFSNSGKNPSEDPEVLKQQTWQNLIYDREAKAQKIQVSDDEVRNQVLYFLSASGITNPTPQVYQGWLERTFSRGGRRNRETPRAFEEKIRELLRIRKLLMKVTKEDSPETPNVEEARKLFSLESNQVSVQMMRFANKEEADQALKKLKSAKAWKEETEKNPSQTTDVPMTPLNQMMRLWQMTEQDVIHLHSLEIGSLLQPIPSGSEFVVIRLTDKKTADEKQFEQSKEEFLKKITEQKKYEKFMQWNVELYQRANLKDYIPSAQENNIPQ